MSVKQKQANIKDTINNASDQEQSKKNKMLLVIFVIAVIGFSVLIYNRPTLEDPHVFDGISFPPNAKQLQKLSHIVSKYMDDHFFYTIFAFFYLYILLQAFAIPGPIFLCLLSPTLYGPVKGFFICIACSCLGASLCFLMSSTLAKQLVLRKFPALFAKFNSMVRKNQHNLFWYMLFLRLTPLIPNWFVNLGSPLVGIPYKYFIVASIFGLMPMNFILIQTGQTLKQIESIGIKTHHFITLLVLGVLALIPTFIGKKYQHKFEDTIAQPNQQQIKLNPQPPKGE